MVDATRPRSDLTECDETWQRRIRELYANIEELYSHVDITVVVFDRDLVEVRPCESSARDLVCSLAELARRVLDTGEPQRAVALDQTGRQHAHAFALRDHDAISGVACIVEDDGARRELFVRCAMATFDGYRQNEAALLERERRAHEEARRANVLRDHFLAVIAHELRAPMTSILLWEQVLRDPALAPETRTSALDAIRESAAGQAMLVTDLLDVSRAINGKLRIDLRPTAVARVLAMAIEDARPHAIARHVELVADLAAELGHVLGDSHRLRQVFDNLLSNAIKCTEHGRISVRAWPSDEWITIVVSDTGRGIAAGFLPHVFEPFRQADNSEPGGGLGLGLGIAYQVVALHGGTLTASSEGLGRGAQFTVSLPRLRAGVPDEQSVRTAIAGIRVLVVDDDRRLIEALQILLNGAGAVVTTATSVAMATAMLEAGGTDILLSDLGMTGVDGYTLVRTLRATPGAMQRLPAIAVTARVSDDCRERAFAAGFDRYLTKPIDVPLLVSTIAQLVRAAEPLPTPTL